MSEIARIKKQIEELEAQLKNIGFLSKAKPHIINEKKKKLQDFTSLLSPTISAINFQLEKLVQEPFVTYFVVEIRLDKFKGELFSEEYFSIVNGENITDEEREELLGILNKGTLIILFRKNIERL
jgi:hypothetical protein